MNTILSQLSSLYELEHPKNINSIDDNDELQQLQYETYINQCLIDFNQYLTEKKSSIKLNSMTSLEKTREMSQLKSLVRSANKPGCSLIQKQNNLITKDMLPILTKKGYTITPSLETMLTMKKKKINKMKNVTISNQHGMIEWLKKIDIEKLNLNDNVFIEPGRIILYQGKEMPKHKEGLNKKALVTLYNCSVSNPNLQLQPKQLKAMVKNIGGKVLKATEGVFVFLVKHF